MKRNDFLKTLALLPLTGGAMTLQSLYQFQENFQLSDLQPVLFVGHGSPMNAIEDNPFTRSLRATGTKIREKFNPQAVLVVSAHWLTRGSFVCTIPKPETIHDFGGFPQELFDTQYPAPGAPEVAKSVTEMLPHIGGTDEWGLDHGSWSILMHLFPKADLPVFQLSIDYDKPMEYHYELGKQLMSLRQKGVMIIGSGNIVHNLRMSMQRLSMGDNRPYDWAIEFDEWTKKNLESTDFNALVHYENAGNAGQMSVPTTDHYIPMLYTLGLAKDKEPLTQIYEEVGYGGISMRTFGIGV